MKNTYKREEGIFRTINDFAEDVFELNDAMASHPELSGQEKESSESMVRYLRAKGVRVEYPFAGFEYAFKASLGCEEGGRKVAILAEYDALPEVGHACGHCASGMASFLAALAINQYGDLDGWQIDLIGTPDEEYAGAKGYMAEKGVFSDYEFAILVHMDNKNMIGCNYYAEDVTELTFHGVSSHAGGAPEKGISALNAVRLLFQMVDMMRLHLSPSVRIHGYIKNGGTAPNVIADLAVAEFSTRAPNINELKTLTSWFYDCAEAAAKATRTTLKIKEIGIQSAELFTSQATIDLFNKVFEELNLEIADGRQRLCGSSDIGNVDLICPCFSPHISIGKPYTLHTKEFGEAMMDEDTHKAIIAGAKVIIKAICYLIEDEVLLDQIKKQHRLYRGLDL